MPTTLDELQKLFDEYIKTLNDDYDSEYISDREAAKNFTDGFLVWLKARLS